MELMKQIDEATHTRGLVPSPLDALIAGSRSLRVGVVQYGPICRADDPTAFLNAFTRHFASPRDLAKDSLPEFSPANLSSVEGDLCDTGTFDFVIGVFAEPRRAMRLWFYRDLPLLIPLNAVAFTASLSGRDDAVRQALFRGRAIPCQETLLPIVDRTELGGIYIVELLLDLLRTRFTHVPSGSSKWLASLWNGALPLEKTEFLWS